MPFTFRKNFQFTRWLRLNVNRKSHSWTLGRRGGPKYTRSSTGRDTFSWNLPGGFGYRTSRKRGSRR